MDKCLISVTQQLAIIKEARETLTILQEANYTISFRGLCGILKKSIYNLSKKESWFDTTFADIFDENMIHVKDYFPMFTLENAKKCAAFGYKHDLGYWWMICPYDYDNRLKFLDWMEEDILK